MTQGIGDLESTDKGSGARFNTGKPNLALIPLEIIAAWMNMERGIRMSSLVEALACLGEFQTRKNHRTARRTLLLLISELGADWDACARVFDYGREKYAEWNWAKGMPWSAVIASCARHLLAMSRGEVNDPESGLSHTGHAMCNVVMLWTYCETYLEGDDRPPAGLFMPAIRSDRVIPEDGIGTVHLGVPKESVE